MHAVFSQGVASGGTTVTHGTVHAAGARDLGRELEETIAALLRERIAFEGKSLGREIPADEPAAVSG